LRSADYSQATRFEKLIDKESHQTRQRLMWSSLGWSRILGTLNGAHAAIPASKTDKCFSLAVKGASVSLNVELSFGFLHRSPIFYLGRINSLN